MAELAASRRTAIRIFWHWLKTQRESIISLAILALVTYGWVLTSPIF